MTARDLGEFIRSGTYTTALDCQEDSFNEFVGNKINGPNKSKAEYINTIESLIDRLNFVEKNGYSSPVPLEESRDHIEEADSNDIILESNKTKKKKKKRKGQTQAQEKKENDMMRASIDVSREDVDPMMSPLLAMGFGEDKINAAFKACGGSNRATVDDLVTWMLENGVPSDGESASQKAENEFVVQRNREDPASKSLEVVVNEQSHDQSVLRAQVAAEEAMKKQAEAKAAADRLAAKREEQRRIRREWNNREQLRQKQEAQAKLVEEVERRRNLEIEKAKRVAQERVSSILLHNPILSNSISPQNTELNGNGTTLLFPVPSTQSNEGQFDLPESDPILKQSFDQPGLLSSSHSQPPVQYECKNNSSDSIGGKESINSSPNEKRSRSCKKPSKKSPTHLKVNALDFPQLGRDKFTPPSTPKTSKSTSKDSQKEGNVSPTGKKSQKGKQKKKDSPSKSKNRVTLPEPSLIPQASDQHPPSYDSNPLGEIRATAREFVPSFAVNQGSEGPRFTGSKLPQSLPPGIPTTIKSNMENDILSHIPQQIGDMLPQSGSSFEREAASSPAVLSVSSYVQDRMNLRQNDKHSPSASATSSVTGLSGVVLDEAFTLHANNGPISFENNSDGQNHVSTFLDSNLAIAGPSSSIPLTGMAHSSSGLGILETNSNTLSGNSIWGGGTTHSAASGLGFSPFNYGQGVSSTLQVRGGSENSTLDENENEVINLNINSNMWGSNTTNNGGGSIW